MGELPISISSLRRITIREDLTQFSFHTGPAVAYNLTVTFYALQGTTFKIFLDHVEVESDSFYGMGNVVKQASLAKPVTAPSKQKFKFVYNDACRSYSSKYHNVYVDERVAGVSLQVSS